MIVPPSHRAHARRPPRPQQQIHRIAVVGRVIVGVKGRVRIRLAHQKSHASHADELHASMPEVMEHKAPVFGKVVTERMTRAARGSPGPLAARANRTDRRQQRILRSHTYRQQVRANYNQPSSWTDYAQALAERPCGIGKMLKHCMHRHRIENAVAKRQALRVRGDVGHGGVERRRVQVEAEGAMPRLTEKRRAPARATSYVEHRGRAAKVAVDEADVTRIVCVRGIAIGEAGPNAIVVMAVQVSDVLPAHRRRSLARTVVLAHSFSEAPLSRDQ